MSEINKAVIELYPNHAFYNAGLLGLYDVLMTQAEKMGDYDAIAMLEGSAISLKIPARLFYGIETAWVDTVIKRFRPQSACAELLSRYNACLDAANKSEASEAQVNALLSDAEKKLSSASYKNAMIAISGGGDTYDPLPVIKPLVKSKESNPSERMLSAKPVFDYIERHKRLFMMKDFAYTVLNQYWTNKAFLNPTKNKVDMEMCFGQDFIRPIEKLLDEAEKNNDTCFECGAPTPAKYLDGMTWICDMGIDDARKRSNYWNFKADAYICPVCMLVYSCMPLGYTIVGGQGMFVNTNAGIRQLAAANGFRQNPDEKLKSKGIELDETNGRIAYKRLRAHSYLAMCEGHNSEKQLESVQTVLRLRSGGDKPVYRTELLTRPQLFAIKGCENVLMALVKITIKLGEQYINLFDEAMENLISGRNQHTLIQTVMYAQTKENRSMYPARLLLNVQIHQKGGEDVENTDRMARLVYVVAHEGSDLRLALSGDENEKNNKLRGYIYKLLNYVKAGNRKDFFDTVIRMYAGLGKELPTDLFVKMQGDDETFTTLAQSYIMGLSGDIDSKKKAEEAESKEEK